VILEAPCDTQSADGGRSRLESNLFGSNCSWLSYSHSARCGEPGSKADTLGEQHRQAAQVPVVDNASSAPLRLNQPYGDLGPLSEPLLKAVIGQGLVDRAPAPPPAPVPSPAPPPVPAPADLRKVAGVLLAVMAGGLSGVQSVPATLDNMEHPAQRPTAVIFPQCLGIWMASNALYLTYAGCSWILGRRVPHSVIRPAYTSGAIWAIGFSFMIWAISELGFAVAYTMDAVGPILVASVLSVFVFKEVKGNAQLALFWCAITLQLVGVWLIAAFGGPAAS